MDGGSYEDVIYWKVFNEAVWKCKQHPGHRPVGAYRWEMLAERKQEVYRQMAKDYMKTLFDNMDQEQEKYREWLLQQPPETILDHAYQYAVREDIIMAFSESDFELDQDQAGALLTRKSPLQTLLTDYTKLDSNVSTTLREVFMAMPNPLGKSLSIIHLMRQI